MEPTFWRLLLQTFPETLAVTSLAVALAGRKLDAKVILLIGLSQTIAVHLTRLLDFAFGVHTIILAVILAITLTLVLKVKLSRSLLTALLAIIILAVIETASVMLILTLTGAEFEEVAQDTTLWILYGWPQIIVIFLLALAVNRWRQKRRIKAGGTDV